MQTEPSFHTPDLQTPTLPFFIVTLKRPHPFDTHTPLVLLSTFDADKVLPFAQSMNFPPVFLTAAETTIKHRTDPDRTRTLKFFNGALAQLPQGGSVHLNVVDLPHPTPRA